MSGIEEIKEHLEHAAHEGGGHGGNQSKLIGVTMATLGVMLAVCAAMLGAERTELIRTMVEQSNKWGVYQAETMKYRVIEADFELLKALSPKAEEIKKMDETLRSKRAPSGKLDDEDTAEVKDLIASAVDDLADLLTPDRTEKVRFSRMAEKYKVDMHEAKEDAEAYDLRIEAHQEGAEGYEKAQLAAEIGIVIASVALLLANRKVWYVSLALVAACTGLGGMTFTRTHALLGEADAKIKAAAARTLAIEKDDDEDDDGIADAKQEGGEKPAAGAGHEGAKHEEKAAEKAEPAKQDEKKAEPKPEKH